MIMENTSWTGRMDEFVKFFWRAFHITVYETASVEYGKMFSMLYDSISFREHMVLFYCRMIVSYEHVHF